MGDDAVSRARLQDILLGIVAGCLLAAGAVLILIFLLANAPLPSVPAPIPQHATTHPAPRK
jgi:hypothetical protein